MLLASSGGNWDDEPSIKLDDVGGDEIYAIAGIRAAASRDVALVGPCTLIFGALDLDSQEVSVVLDGEIVGRGVAPGLGDTQAVLRGAGHEAQLRPFAPALGVGDVDPGIWHGNEKCGPEQAAFWRKSPLCLLYQLAIVSWPRLLKE